MKKITQLILTLGPAVLPCLAQFSDASEVIVNGRILTPVQIERLQAVTGAPPATGCYWYDPRSGFYGHCGRETAGAIRPGLDDFGPVSANASRGNTRIFLNGRQLNIAEKAFFERLFGRILPSRWWLDGWTGNIGREGSPAPQVNLVSALQRQRHSGAYGDNAYRARDGRGTVGYSDGDCTFMAVPGAPVYSTRGCN